MSANELIERLRARKVCKDGIRRQPQKHEREAADRIEYLERRLEVVPGLSEDADGIACRDETIRLQDARIAAQAAEIERLNAIKKIVDAAPNEDVIAQAHTSVNYKYFGDYALSEDQWDAVWSMHSGLMAIRSIRQALKGTGADRG